MRWEGKLIGAFVGLLLRRPVFIVLGFLLGHAYDMAQAGPATPKPPPPPPGPDPYALLGISVTASDAEVEQAYRRKMSEYHPDRVANAAAEIRALAEARAREINAAYETIQQQRRIG